MESAMITHLVEINRRDFRQVAAESEPRSAIETRYPRIAHELSARWKGRDIDTYLDNLLIDTRGNRMGFPADVLEEIMFLAGIRWYLGKTEIPDTLESPRDEFSFCSDGFRRCGTTGSWVLT
jgi:hypothetical protein